MSENARIVTHNVTELLGEWRRGDETALERLTATVYQELRRLAGSYLRRERQDHTLQATALVHEAFMDLRGMQDFDWQSRAHFIGIAARTMRRILVEHARAHNAEKRGGGAFKVTLGHAGNVVSGEPPTDLVALEGSLDALAGKFPRQAQVVELHFFGGLKFKDIAEVLSASGTSVSLRTVERDWEFARAWLRRELSA